MTGREIAALNSVRVLTASCAICHFSFSSPLFQGKAPARLGTFGGSVCPSESENKKKVPVVKPQKKKTLFRGVFVTLIFSSEKKKRGTKQARLVFFLFFFFLMMMERQAKATFHLHRQKERHAYMPIGVFVSSHFCLPPTKNHLIQQRRGNEGPWCAVSQKYDSTIANR